MVSVSVAPELVSPMVTPTNGATAASAVVVCPGVVTVMVGRTAASLSVTFMVLLGALVVPAELASLQRQRSLLCWSRGKAFRAGVKTSALSSEVMVAAGAAARV